MCPLHPQVMWLDMLGGLLIPLETKYILTLISHIFNYKVMPQINGIDTSLITGLGQIGVGTGSAPITYPSGGLITNAGGLSPRLVLLNGNNIPSASFYKRPDNMDSASLGTSEWVKIVANDLGFYLLSSSKELYAVGSSTIYTGTGKANTLAKVTTGSNWTDIAAGQSFVIGICDGKLFGIGLNSNGQFGRGNTTSIFTNFGIIDNNTYWTRVSAGNGFSIAMSGSGGSGSIFTAGNNLAGRTGQNTTTGNTTTWTQPFGFTGSIFTDISCGEDYALAISGGNIYGTGEAGSYQLGNNSTVDRTTFGLVSSASTFAKVFAFTDFSKAIDINEHHYHTGDESYTRGDGDTSTAVLTWTRLNTSGEFASGWQNFYSNNLTFASYIIIGVKNYRPYYIGTQQSYTDWMPNSTWTYYRNASTATWTAFVSSSVNVSCSAAAVAFGYTGNVLENLLMINLTPTS
jgi:hypothetical protein